MTSRSTSPDPSRKRASNVSPRSKAAKAKGSALSGRVVGGTTTLKSWEEVGPDGIIRPKERVTPTLPPRKDRANSTVNGVVLLGGEHPADYDWR